MLKIKGAVELHKIRAVVYNSNMFEYQDKDL